MTSKILKSNGQVIYTSTYHALTDDEMANPEEAKACQAFDAAVTVKLGAPMSKHNLPSDGVDADTPTFELYEDNVTPPLRLPDADKVTPEMADSYVGAQVNLPIWGDNFRRDCQMPYTRHQWEPSREGKHQSYT